MFLIISEIYLFLFRTHVNIGRNPASTSGSVFNVNFVYALKEDNSKFVEFIVKATLE